MRRKGLLRASRVFLGVVLAALVLSQAVLARAATPVAATAQVDDLLRQGVQLEQQGRWSEAMAVYEDGVRQHPSERALQRRFEFTRLHHDVARRYNDSSFRDSLLRLSFNESLDLYSEVLLKIQTHYVEAPHWKELVERGTNAFEVAMSEPAFLEGCRVRTDGPALDQFRQELRRTLGPRMIQSRNDARTSVSLVAAMAAERLGVSQNAVVLEYACGAADTLDLYSSYLTPGQLNDIYSQIEGNFVGLGIELKADNGSLLIVRVIPGSPAQKGGLRDGDRILAVDGQQTRDCSTDRAANLLQGEAGSVANLVVESPNQQPRQLRIRRERVEVPSIDDVRIVDRPQGVGYLKLTCFQKTTSRDLDTALWNLHRQGMRSLIIDLRGNPGGLLVSAVEVADKFIERGVIVSTHGRNSQEDFTYSAHEPGTWRMPLVLIIDQDSASAAEIFAGAIRDHRRGTLVGTRSYGKGSVQGIFPLGSSSAGLRLTTAKFYSPKGYPFVGVGVQPDLTVHNVARPADAASVASPTGTNDDPMLATALEAVRQMIAQR
ncbi:MAG: S41 family peptidase [Thermoguttaceae bacterium]|jgi:carboxyl-terminal processing protease